MNGSSKETGTTRNRYVLTIPFLAVILLALIGALFPGRMTWGISFLSVFSPALALVAVGFALAVSIPPVAAGLSDRLGPVFDRLTGSFPQINRQLLVILISVGTTAALYHWRSRSYLYGDGYIVLGDASSGDEFVLMGQKYLQLMTIYLNYYVYEAVTRFVEWSPERVLGLSNAIGGMVGLWAIYRICRQLADDAVTRAFMLLGALSSASVVLFFGYIENYTWALSSGLWTLSFSLGFIRRQNGGVVLIVAATVTAALHLITLPFAVAAVMAALMKRGPKGSIIVGIPLKHVNAGLVVGSILMVILTRVFDLRIFVPLWPLEGNPYSAFSASHIVDVFNQIALVAPLGAAMVIMKWIHFRKSPQSHSFEADIIGTTALLFFLEAVWINPELGAPRDWDLLAFYGLPLTFWGLYHFTRYFKEGRVGQRWLVPVTAVAGIVLIPNLFEKNHADISAARLDALLDVDPHYQVTYESASRCEPWAVALQKGYGGWRLAMKYLERDIQANPGSANLYFNLSDSYYFMGIPDSAYMYVQQGLRLKPNDVQKLLNASTVASELKRFSEAAAWAEKAVQLDPENTAALGGLGLALANAGRPREGLVYARRAYELEPDTYQQIANVGLVLAASGVADSAHQYFLRALEVCPGEKEAHVYYCLANLCIDMNRFDEAAGYTDKLHRIEPNSPNVMRLASRLTAVRKR